MDLQRAPEGPVIPFFLLTWFKSSKAKRVSSVQKMLTFYQVLTFTRVLSHTLAHIQTRTHTYNTHVHTHAHTHAGTCAALSRPPFCHHEPPIQKPHSSISWTSCTNAQKAFYSFLLKAFVRGRQPPYCEVKPGLTLTWCPTKSPFPTVEWHWWWVSDPMLKNLCYTTKNIYGLPLNDQKHVWITIKRTKCTC